LLARLGIPDLGPDPAYGGQLNDRGAGIPAEGRLVVSYEESAGNFADGGEFRLRRPRLSIDQLSQGKIHPETRTSLRVPPTLVGLGLLEAVPATQLEALADPGDQDGDGISGRVQRIPGPSGTVVGRFGWKAGQPNLESQIARAFSEDLGVTSALYPHPNCSSEDEKCLKFAGREVELSEVQLQRVTLYTRLLAPPARRAWQEPEVLQGRELFLELRCDSCHRPELVTGDGTGPGSLPELAGQTIRPFTDLLLHDMGPELADGVSEHAAAPSEWRTSPLWGLGLMARVNGHLRLLHDGRAETIEEAILWHGGEAEASRKAYIQLSEGRRSALLRFLNSL